jgi:hypothetical protein
MAKQHARVELYYDGLWSDHTTRVYTRDPIEVTRGRGDQQGEPTPGTATLKFSGLDESLVTDDRYNPRNPISDLYSKIGRNTPLRISNGPTATLADAFARTITNGWNTVRYTFDSTDDGWVGEGTTSTARVVSPVHDGAGALRATKTMGAGFDSIRFNDASGLADDISAGGATLAIWALVPAGAAGTSWTAHIEVQDSTFTWQPARDVSMIPGTWTLITYTPGSALLSNCRAIGVQFGATGVNGSQSVYVDTVAQYTPETEALWTLSGGTVPDDYDTNGTHALHTHPSANVLHYSTSHTGSTNHRVQTVVRLSAGTLTGANASTWVLGRFADVSNYYAALVTMSTAGDVTIGIYKRVAGTLTQVVAPTTTHASYGGLFDDYQFGIELLVEGSTLKAKIWDYTNHDEPTTYNITGTDTSLTAGTSVGVADRRETGNTNANLEFQYDSFLAVPGTIRFTGEVASWKPRRAVKGDAWTEVTAKGVLHRLSQGATPLHSALWRAIQASSPSAHWPVNEGSNALSIGSALSGGSPMQVSMFDYTTGDPAAVSWESRSIAPWLEPVATPATGLVLRFEGPITMDSGTLEWVGDYVFSVDVEAAATGQVVVVWKGTGDATAASPRTEWIFGFFDAGSGTSYELTRRVRAASVTDTLVSSGLISYADGKPKHARLTTTRDGADVDWQIELNAAVLDSGTLAGSDWGPLAFADVQSTANAGQVSVAQVAAWADTTPALNAANATAVGRSGETVADRLDRLCGEEGIPFTLVGTAADTMPAGPQPLDTLVGQFAECERTDGGLLFETRTEQGITYRTRTSLYSQTPALVLDFDAGEVAPPIEPDIDDLNVRNDITVSNRDGTSARAVQEVGPLNIQSPSDDPDGVGRYDSQYDVNVDFDHEPMLAQIATWQRHHGTDESTRYPSVTADLDAAPSLVSDVDVLDIGDVAAIDNLEADQVAQLVPGYGETIGSHRRLWTANAAPARPWEVAVLDDDALGRLDTEDSELASDITTTATSLSVTTNSGPLWTTAAGEMPFTIRCGGEVMTVTAIAGASSPQTFTVTRSTNGVVKAHSAGAAVNVANPVVIGL